MSPGSAPDGGRGQGGDELDDFDDDASLKAMRSVWLEMRDEEPGTGGLGALLAAASAKAAEMKPPSLWQRLGALLTRPPALAFATVLVLVSGAVVVSQQAKDAPPEVAAVVPRSPAPVAAPEGQLRGGVEQLEQALAPAADEGSGATTTAAPIVAAPSPAPVPVAKTKKPSKPMPASAHGDDGDGSPGGSAGVVVGRFGYAGKAAMGDAAPPPAQAEVAAEPAPAPPAAPAPAQPPALDALKSDPKPAKRHAAADADVKLEAKGDAKPEAQNDAELAAFERKAIAAADAGDCATVTKLLAQIAQRDPDARARLAQRPAIQGCVARTKAPAPTHADER